jgi:anti-sigma factor RsiW
MVRCWSARRNLTGWLDGELPERQARRVSRHLGTCKPCSAEAEGLRAAVDWQRRVLPCLVTVGELDASRLRFELLSAVAAAPNPTLPAWTPFFRPIAVAGAAALVGAILFLVSVLGGPNAVLIPLGVESPPVAVTREPDLFENYQLIQQLDVLENFDTVESEPLDDDQSPQQG